MESNNANLFDLDTPLYDNSISYYRYYDIFDSNSTTDDNNAVSVCAQTIVPNENYVYTFVDQSYAQPNGTYSCSYPSILSTSNESSHLPTNQHLYQQEVNNDPDLFTTMPVLSPTVTQNDTETSSQFSATLKWLQDNFHFKASVSISRSTIYELYQRFCQQSHYTPVCKASFGKIIRVQFPRVKSKRLGARGQSKYHYYNITFRENRNRFTMLLCKNESNNGTDSIGDLTTVDPVSANHIKRMVPNQTYSDRLTSSVEMETSVSVKSGFNHRLTILSKRKFGNLSDNLNENDYHTIIQSMLSFMKLPTEEPLNNGKYVFINLYKIHCQCLIDSALSGNYSQMRHYIMHFWQQLPRHVIIYVDLMNALDAHMYTLLSDIYLSVESPVDNLKRLLTIVSLLPIWLEKTFENFCDVSDWQIESSAETTSLRLANVGQIKVDESTRWKHRIKFTIDLLAMIKKINYAILPQMLRYLIELLNEKLYQRFRQIDSNNRLIVLGDVVPISIFNHSYQPFYNLNSSNNFNGKPYGHYLWQIFTHQFKVFLERLSIEIDLFKQKNFCNNSYNTQCPFVVCQMMVDLLDQMLEDIEKQIGNHMVSADSTGDNLHSRLALLFSLLAEDINRNIAMKSFDVDSIDDNELDFEEITDSTPSNSSCSDSLDEHYSNSEEQNNLLNVQVYLFLMVIQNYLLEICQTIYLKQRFQC